MQNISNLLNTPQAENIFRRHRVIQRGMAGVREGHDKKGSHFMIDLVKAVSPGSVLNGNFGDDSEMGPPTFEQWSEQNSGSTGRGWAFWEKTLSMVGKTGNTWADFKANLLGSPEKEVDVQAQQKQKNQNTLIYVVAAGIIVIVAVLLFWKKG
jgi:hypothetical protein